MVYDDQESESSGDNMGAGASGGGTGIQRCSDAEFLSGNSGGTGRGGGDGRSRAVDDHVKDLCAAFQGVYGDDLSVFHRAPLEFLV